MIEPFRRIHLIRAALQVKGAPEVFIADLLDRMKKMAKTPEEFDRWNKLLDEQDIRLLRMILSPKGGEFADFVLISMAQAIADQYNISPDEFQWNPDRN